MSAADYINNERRGYSLYVLQSRAIPHASDGLKAGGRRALWTGRNGAKWKTASLAGATMPIHPHAPCDGAINTLAATYGNNIPLFKGDGAFGTILKPTAYGASRYTSVSVSSFTKDVVFKDIEIVPMMENYDSTLEEPIHFLPLVPIALLNPQEGIAVGFACNILPRTLDTIVASQLEYFETGKVSDVYPAFSPTDNWCGTWEEDKAGNTKWIFEGSFEKVDATTIRITNLPYGVIHAKYLQKLDKLEENGVLTQLPDASKKSYNIRVKFKRGFLTGKTDEEIKSLLLLYTSVGENLNVINFDGQGVMSTSYTDLVGKFCDWRLDWYAVRYQRLFDILEEDLQKYKDIILAIKKNVGGMASKFKSRSEMKEFLGEIGIVNIDYIADLGIYRFTEEERKKTEAKLVEGNKQLKEYTSILKSPARRREIYIAELKEVLVKHKKGGYS
jgi:DNA gyrase/topoisomerase IV subunit A